MFKFTLSLCFVYLLMVIETGADSTQKSVKPPAHPEPPTSEIAEIRKKFYQVSDRYINRLDKATTEFFNNVNVHIQSSLSNKPTESQFMSFMNLYAKRFRTDLDIAKKEYETALDSIQKGMYTPIPNSTPQTVAQSNPIKNARKS